MNKKVLVVWKDGSWRVQGVGDAYYAAQSDANWLVNIPLRALLPEGEEGP